ncbi:MAG: hypothetical protein Q4D06_07770 [Coriobacteriia bacterium]|nr:hypothetical protein [Coriobacteriia bacterium]
MMKPKHTTQNPGRIPQLGNIPDPNAAYDPSRSMQDAARLYSERTGSAYQGHQDENQPAPKRSRRGLKIGVAVVAVAVVVGGGAILAPKLAPQLADLLPAGAQIPGSQPGLSVSDTEAGEPEPSPEEPTPLMASSSGFDMHCAVHASDLTEVLIHNASNEYALPITTKLKEADNEKTMESHGTHRKAEEQPTGNEWLTGKFIRCWRAGYAGPTMSAIDCGAKAGSQVVAPVTGKVVLVKKYDLYGEPDYPDVRVHIEPDENPDVDVVLIHLKDPTVKAGDRVEGGVTPLAKIRNVYKYLGDQMQLRDYTKKGDNGNHTHVCVNDKNHPDYHGLDDLKPKPKKKDKDKSGQNESAAQKKA